MKQVLVVDGANVVGSRPDGWWKDRAGAARRLHEELMVADTSYDEVHAMFTFADLRLFLTFLSGVAMLTVAFAVERSAQVGPGTAMSALSGAAVVSARSNSARSATRPVNRPGAAGS